MSSHVKLSGGVQSTNRPRTSVNLNAGPDTHSLSTFGQDTVHISGLGERNLHCTRHATRDPESPSLGSFSTFGVDRVTLSELGQQTLRCNIGQ